MGIVPAHIYVSSPEAAAVCDSVGFPPNASDIAVALEVVENDGQTGSYRLSINNPLSGGVLGVGDDIGLWSANTKAQAQHIPGRDQFALFDLISNTEFLYARWLREGGTAANPAAGFGALNYGPNAYGPRIQPPGTPRPARTDAEIHLTEIKAQVAVRVNPYWRLKKAGMRTGNLPVPPVGSYVSRLPTSDLKYGDILGSPGKKGDDLGQLQRLLAEMGRWGRPGQFDRSYFNTVAGIGPYLNMHMGIRSIQEDLRDLGYWSGTTDGKRYDAPLRAAWDGLMRAELMGLVL